jgi:hypothetical protein
VKERDHLEDLGEDGRKMKMGRKALGRSVMDCIYMAVDSD